MDPVYRGYVPSTQGNGGSYVTKLRIASITTKPLGWGSQKLQICVAKLRIASYFRHIWPYLVIPVGKRGDGRLFTATTSLKRLHHRLVVIQTAEMLRHGDIIKLAFCSLSTRSEVRVSSGFGCGLVVGGEG